MKPHRFPDRTRADATATNLLCDWLGQPGSGNAMVAAGQTPLELYRGVSQRGLDLTAWHVFTLDEYVGVPLAEPRNCANLLRRCVAEAWGVPADRFHAIDSLAATALSSARKQEELILQRGGLDLIVLGLGQNGHLGFNEPGSGEDSEARLLDLEPISTEANRRWFDGDYAPSQGVTVGLKTILAARRILLLAYGSTKTAAVHAMVRGPRTADCPASFLQGHPEVHVFLDQAAASSLD